ncbi:hypothetical protein ACVBEF_14640 [Glaciimonas sp. GG7]
MLFFGISRAAEAENWVHLQRVSDPKISQSDRGPYDEYLDTDFIDFDGKWTLINTKIVSDESANEYHGKMELWTWGISCRELKMGSKGIRQFLDDDGESEQYSKVSTVADLDRFSRIIQPFQKESVSTIFFVYACFGATPKMWAEREKSITQ